MVLGYVWLAGASRTPPGDLPETPSLDTVAALVPGIESGAGLALLPVWKEDVHLPFRQMFFVAPPDTTVRLEAPDAAAPLTAEASAGRVQASGETVAWQAPPDAGPYELRVRDATGARIHLTALVHEPFDVRQTHLNGYEIGAYPRSVYQGNPRYAPPTGLIPVRSEADRDVPVSPHFTLGQFIAKQASGYPKYLLLDERLIVKLEHLLEKVREAGFDVETLFVMSGYRTPFYNASIGNETTFSAHVYGMAADVFVDADGDGVMDDLDGDGQITVEDARLLYRMAEPLDTLYDGALTGGLGLYAPAPHRGPFIHVDVRGTPARW